MGFTYSHDPQESDLDYVRWTLFDTDEDKYFLTDEEIEAELALQDSVLLAAAVCAERLATLFSQKTSWVRGRVEIRPGEMADRYWKIAARLREQAEGVESFDAGSVYAGGISAETVEVNELDADIVQPRFKRDQFESA